MYKLKSVGVMSVGKVIAIIQGAIGLLFLPFFVLVGLAGALAGKDQQGAIAAGVMVVLAVLMPVIYAAIGFVMGVLMAFIYNAVASKIGGIEFELATLDPPAQFTTASPMQP